jgi:two-component system response regulator
LEHQALLLVAEDDPDDQYFFQEAMAVIRPTDVETHIVFDGAQLMRFLREKTKGSYRRSLVILDLNMRVKDGRITLQEIKSNPAFAWIPVVVLTTSDNEEDAEYCLRNGAAAYYRKPSSIVELVKIIRTLYKDYLN